MTDIFSAGASIAGSAMQASAIKKSTQMQIKALEKQRQFVFDNLDPSVINEQAAGADIERAEQRLALQSQIDPSLLATRFVSQDALLKLAQEGANNQGDTVAAQLFERTQAELGDTREDRLRSELIDAALDEVGQGASLPADVQAELVQAGLERSGTVGTGGSSRSLAGKLTRKLIGNEAIALKKARQDQAGRLGLTSQQLGNNRLGILSSVFPALKNLQQQNQNLQTGALSTSNQLVPEVGLGGADIANIFQARVGATNQIAQSAADTAARGGLAQAAAINQGIGTAASAIGSIGRDTFGEAGTTAGILKAIF
jgi:hypothetical protein